MCFFEILLSCVASIFTCSLIFGYIVLCRRSLGNIRFVQVNELGTVELPTQVRYSANGDSVSWGSSSGQLTNRSDGHDTDGNEADIDEFDLDSIFPEDLNFTEGELEEALASLGLPADTMASLNTEEPLYYELE